MIKIQNKEESLTFIKTHHLNHFGEVNFKRNDYEGVKQFLNKYPVPYYFLRELKNGSSNVFYTLSKEQVLEKVPLYENFGLDVSSFNYKNHIKLCAEIYYGKDGIIFFSGSTNPKSTHRSFLNPNYFKKTTFDDPSLKYIPYLDLMIDYIYRHNLFDLIIEFVVFDTPVGVEQEPVIIYEVRTDY